VESGGAIDAGPYSNSVTAFAVSADHRLRRVNTVPSAGSQPISVTAAHPVSTPSTGATPFGFSFDRFGHLLVSNAEGGAARASTVTAYRRLASDVSRCQGRPETTDHPSITQRSTMDMKEAPIRQETLGQSLDQLCAARDSNPEPAD
jgi:hypothetical protein